MLLSDVRRFAERKGAKRELAKFLKVSPSRVSEWLAGDYWSPSGEVALAMSEWVETEQAKQKSPGRVRARPEPKTRKTKALYDKRKSGHR